MDQPRPRPRRIPVRRLLLRLAAVAIVAIAVGLVVWLFVWPTLDVGTGDKSQPLPTLPPTAASSPTNRQAFIDDHGPWLSTSDSLALRSATGVRNLALFGDTGLIYSSKSVAFSARTPWILTPSPAEIAGVSVSGTAATIVTQKGLTFVLNVTQPFVLNNDYDRVYVIDRNQKLWSASVADLTFVDAAQVADQSLPANNRLSTSITS